MHTSYGLLRWIGLGVSWFHMDSTMPVSAIPLLAMWLALSCVITNHKIQNHWTTEDHVSIYTYVLISIGIGFLWGDEGWSWCPKPSCFIVNSQQWAWALSDVEDMPILLSSGTHCKLEAIGTSQIQIVPWRLQREANRDYSILTWHSDMSLMHVAESLHWRGCIECITSARSLTRLICMMRNSLRFQSTRCCAEPPFLAFCSGRESRTVIVHDCCSATSSWLLSHRAFGCT